MNFSARFTIGFSLLLGLGACATKSPDLPISLPSPPVVAALRSPSLALPPIAPALDMGVPWLYLDEFFPAGAHRILPLHGPVAPKLVETPRAWFPSVLECISPDHREVLFHEAYRGEGFNHLVFVRTPGSDTRVPLLATRDTAEVLWSPDSRRIAVSMLTGNNSSSVYIVELNGHKLSDAIATEEEVTPRLGQELAHTPHFIMALRWTDNGELVVRARGRRLRKPHTIFGYECLVDVTRLGQVGAVRFLRGFTKQPIAGTD